MCAANSGIWEGGGLNIFIGAEMSTKKRGRQQKMSRQFATNVTTIYDILQQVATFYHNFRRIVPFT